MPRNLHELPRLRDSLSYLYIEHAIIQKRHEGIEYIQEGIGRVPIPVAALSLLMLGPGTRITHAAVRILADNGCSILWVGEGSTRFYAAGIGETRHAHRLLHQAALVSDPAQRLKVVHRMYERRFGERLDPSWSIERLRGLEGNRVRTAYYEASRKFGVPWSGRRYQRDKWNATDPLNRALSAAHALLNGICHAAIVSGGYSPALGFIHTGKQLSFVYDIADLYKTEITIPASFEVVAKSNQQVEKRVRALCRERFRAHRLLQRILPDIDALLDLSQPYHPPPFDSDPALPSALWTPP